MALIRVIRPLPSKPSQDGLCKLMKAYAITRKTAARLMRCERATRDRYLLPGTARGSQPIPLVRWELLLMKVQAIYHPDEEIEIQLCRRSARPREAARAGLHGVRSEPTLWIRG